MTTNAKIGKGARLGVGDAASPEVFNAVAEVLSIDGPNPSVPMESATHLMSDAEEYIPGIPEWGSVSIECNSIHSDTHQAALRALIASRTVKNFLLTFPTSPTKKILIAGYISDVNNVAEGVGSKMTATFTIKVTGAPDEASTAVITG